MESQRRRAVLCLGVKAFFALPSPLSSCAGMGVHSNCDHLRQQTDKHRESAPSAASRVVGRFQDLKRLSAKAYDLCEYIDIVQGKHDRLFIVSEHYRSNLAKEIQNYQRNGLYFHENIIRLWIMRLFHSLAYLNSMGIIHRNLSVECLLLDGNRDLKLADYG
jgi:serine/threonine protein kinase